MLLRFEEFTSNIAMAYKYVLKIKAYDTGVLAPEINVNGGDIEIDAAYDQALFGTTSLTFNGGHVYVPASYEAFSGATITFNEGARMPYLLTTHGTQPTVVLTAMALPSTSMSKEETTTHKQVETDWILMEA